jgi:hypothetical protein
MDYGRNDKSHEIVRVMRKKQFHLSNEWEAEIDTLVNLLGLGGTYGAEAKALQFSTTFTLAMIKRLENVLPELEPDKMAMVLSSMQNYRKSIIFQNSRQFEPQTAKKVLPQDSQKSPKSNTNLAFDLRISD